MNWTRKDLKDLGEIAFIVRLSEWNAPRSSNSLDKSST